MHKLEIIQKGLSVTFPECIAECTQEQYLMFAGLNLSFLNHEISFKELKVQLLYKLLDLKRSVDLSKNSEAAAKVAENVFRMSELLESFFEVKLTNGKKSRAVRLDYIDNHIPSILLPSGIWYGPKAALSNISFGQYLAANDAFHDFYTYKEVQFLDLLVTHLYVPEGQEYNPKTIDARLKEVASLDIAVKYGVCLFFQACQHWIANQNALDIGGGHTVDLMVLFKKTVSDTTQNTGIGLKSTLYDLAETQVFGDLNETAAHNLFEILVFLVIKHQEAEKLKRNAKNK